MRFQPGGCVLLQDLAATPPALLGGRWALRDVLGHGSTATVFRADDLLSADAIAVKMVRPELAHDPVVAARFVQEHALLRSLDHPHVVRAVGLHRPGDAGPQPVALVLELLTGGDLASRRRRTLAPRDAVRTTAAVLSALAHAHDRGIVHGDVKAANVLLGPRGRVVLGDFGSSAGTGGTPEHLAPELARSGVTARASRAGDVYATGALLFELLTGRTPFAGGTDGGRVLDRHARFPVPEVPGLPPGLAQVMRALLDKQAVQRPSAAEALTALRDVPGLRRARRSMPQRTSRSGEVVGRGGPGWTPDHELDPARTLP